MENKNISLNTKLEVAIEIISSKIAMKIKEGYAIEDKEIQTLILERNKLYSGDEKILDKIINTYGPEIKIYYKGDNNE